MSGPIFKKASRTSQKLTFGLLLLMTLGLLGGLYAFVSDMARQVPPVPVEKVDAIVVLTGGTNRIDAGFRLLEKDFGKKLFISGVYRGVDVKQLLARWKKEPQSSLDCCVVLGFEADNTAGNARETVEWLNREGFKSIYLVTANYHIRRARLEFDRIAPEIAVTLYPIVPDKFDMDSWWKDPTFRSLVLREYAKYVAAWLRSLL